jgi:hypothetical protein
MIKTLHITSIIIGILAAGLIVFGAVLGSDDNDEVDKILQSPGAIEKFKTAKGGKDSRSNNQTSPLVKEAEAFALYLNPPPKPEPKTRSAPKPKKSATSTIRPTAPVSAKFKLIGTVYYPLSPKTSMALIDQPGKGLSWVRQGEEAEHLIFEQIKDGVVVIRDGKQTREIKTPERPEDQAIRKFLASGSESAKSIESKISTSSRKTSSRSSPQPAPQVTPEQMKMFDEIFSKVGSALQEGAEPGESELRMLDEVFSSLSKTRMDDNETNRLRELGETLEQTRVFPSDDTNLGPDLESNFDANLDTNLDLDLEPNSDPNFDPNSSKIQRSTRSDEG